MSADAAPRYILTDARGWRIGLAPSSDEHKGCLDLVAQIPTGHAVLARLDRAAVALLAAALTHLNATEVTP